MKSTDAINTQQKMRQRLKLNRPSLRHTARPPRQRTHVGDDFTAANLPVALALQHCAECDIAQYPPREVCSSCLCGTLVWREAPSGGALLSAIGLHHSLWEYFKRRITPQTPWPIGSVRLDCNVTVFVHLAVKTFAAGTASSISGGTRVQVFSHSDCSRNSVLIGVSVNTPIESAPQRQAIAAQLSLDEPALTPGGI